MMKFFLHRSIDQKYPFFCGAAVGGWLCFLLIFPYFEAYTGFSLRKPPYELSIQTADSQNENPINVTLAAVTASEPPLPVFSHHSREEEDAILNAYRSGVYEKPVVSFFSGVFNSAGIFSGTNSEEIASSILANASAFDISPSLAFALCWVESRFNPTAVNYTNRDGSIDRGLFQLNNQSFPKLKETDFFNPSVNAYHGMAHLRWCLDTGGSLVAGLAMYNAGTGRVKAAGASKRTLDYISQILEFQRKIENAFAEFPLSEPVVEVVVPEPYIEAEPSFGKPRLALLSPIAGRP
jgi:soluble lytic murein transglycosylase-like protein